LSVVKIPGVHAAGTYTSRPCTIPVLCYDGPMRSDHKRYFLHQALVLALLLPLVGVSAVAVVLFDQHRAYERITAVLPPLGTIGNLRGSKKLLGQTDCYSSFDSRSSCPTITVEYPNVDASDSARTTIMTFLRAQGFSTKNNGLWRRSSHYEYRMTIYENVDGTIRVAVQEYDLEKR